MDAIDHTARAIVLQLTEDGRDMNADRQFCAFCDAVMVGGNVQHYASCVFAQACAWRRSAEQEGETT